MQRGRAWSVGAVHAGWLAAWSSHPVTAHMIKHDGLGKRAKSAGGYNSHSFRPLATFVQKTRRSRSPMYRLPGSSRAGTRI
ncbi:hypothetical protein ABH944_008179 [Caballeronia udeis]|uniref:Uncharacterized protein n=1 Tax=Caballeronia udeis TaxID=1232866 RepID=A0A158ISE9_9BURK|nr:hypothetical protein AWB69_06597 [Caballeronia udeis]